MRRNRVFKCVATFGLLSVFLPANFAMARDQDDKKRPLQSKQPVVEQQRSVVSRSVFSGSTVGPVAFIVQRRLIAKLQRSKRPIDSSAIVRPLDTVIWTAIAAAVPHSVDKRSAMVLTSGRSSDSASIDNPLIQ